MFDMAHANLNITDCITLTFDEKDGALLTTRGKDHDLDEDDLLALRDACDAALKLHVVTRRLSSRRGL